MENLTKTERRILRLAEAQGMKCGYCGKGVHLRLPKTRNSKRLKAHAKRKATIEHVTPRCRDGSNSPENVLIACAHCNSRKGGRPPKGKELRRLKELKESL